MTKLPTKTQEKIIDLVVKIHDAIQESELDDIHIRIALKTLLIRYSPAEEEQCNEK